MGPSREQQALNATLTWTRPLAHRHTATVAGIPIASSDSLDALRAYGMWALLCPFLPHGARMERAASLHVLGGDCVEFVETETVEAA